MKYALVFLSFHIFSFFLTLELEWNFNLELHD